MTHKQAIARIAKLCRENAIAFGKGYDPRWPSGNVMVGAKTEGTAIARFAREILDEITMARRQINRKNRNKHQRDEE